MAAIAIVSPAAAQKETAVFPTRVVTIINGFAPGATPDIIARLMAPKLNEVWGQSVIVENRAGASGLIGLTAVARAPADGHMLGMVIISQATAVALQGGKAGVDLTRDFAHITQVASQPYVLIVNPSLPVRSVRELIALARAKPGAITYGSSGVGSVLHLAGEMLAIQGKVKMTHVPYKGAALALSDLAGGHIAMLFTTRLTAQPYSSNGRARVLAVTANERVPGAPDLPTLQESGVTGPFEVNGWYGVSAAAGTPAATIDKLNQDIQRVLKMPDVRERMVAQGTMPVSGTPAQFAELVRSEIEKWRRTIQQAGIKPETL